MVTCMYNIRLQAPKLARKCEVEHWHDCGAGSQAIGVDRARDQIKYY